MGRKVAIVDYSLGNLFSVQQALAQCGANVFVTNKAEELSFADAIVLPGVGAFGEAMNYLRLHGLDKEIKTAIASGKAFLGICLGMQLLFNKSEEFGSTEGLGIIEGEIKKFRPSNGEKLHVPQVGWNELLHPSHADWQNSPLKDIKDSEYMYFVHSYYSVPQNKEVVLCNTGYAGITYCSGVKRENVTATQFHPEKSGEKGLTIYKNWINTIK